MQSQHWPVYIMSAAEANKDALVGGLWDSYFQCLIEQLTAPSAPAPAPPRAMATAPAAISPSRTLTLHDLFLTAKAMYRQRNVYELYGHICHEAYPSAGISFRSDLQPLLTSGTNGSPDFAKIAQLQANYRNRGGGRGGGRRRNIYIYDTYNWGVEVDLVTVVKRCLLHIALPDCVFGDQSGVHTFNTKETFHFEVNMEAS